ncbi:hypothetical protein D3C78_838740 [compost metagenome]
MARAAPFSILLASQERGRAHKFLLFSAELATIFRTKAMAARAWIEKGSSAMTGSFSHIVSGSFWLSQGQVRS